MDQPLTSDRRKNSRLAGFSAIRRIRYGYRFAAGANDADATAEITRESLIAAKVRIGETFAAPAA